MPNSSLQLSLQFLRFYLAATTVYRVHSPFVYAFCKEVLEDRRWFYAFSHVEHLRQVLLKNEEILEMEDFGVGSFTGGKNPRRRVKAIARTALSPPYQCRILFRIVQHFKPKKMLELGTSLGTSTLYQAQAARRAQFITLEGSSAVAAVAKRLFRRMQNENIELVTGQFEDKLLPALEKLGRLDYAFVDGNHKAEAVLGYFEQCLPFVHEDSVLIFDDIRWSADMEAAWRELKVHPKVGLTIDLFFFGLVFFRPQQEEPVHYKLVPARWKPWIMGFFK